MDKTLQGINKLHWLKLTRVAPGLGEPRLITCNILWVGNEKLPSYSALMIYLNIHQPLNVPPYQIFSQYNMFDVHYDLIEYIKDTRLKFKTKDNRVFYTCKAL